jgi:hypothetical protein
LVGSKVTPNRSKFRLTKMRPFNSSLNSGLALTVPVFGSWIAARDPIQGLATQAQKFTTAGILDVELALNPIP